LLAASTQALGYDVENEGALDQHNPDQERLLFEYAQRISQMAAEDFNRRL
jgi:hypothetical protein